MSEMAKSAREAMKEKAHRMADGDPHQKTDASSWSPPEAMKTGVKTGMRPISRRQYKRGGKVEGETAKMRADRKPRGSKMLPDSFANVDQRDANEEREGEKHIGGFARGGRPHRDMGGSNVPTQRMAFQGGPSALSKEAGIPSLKTGGRAHKLSGGEAGGENHERAGYNAFMNKRYEARNPHPAGSAANTAWAKGSATAQDHHGGADHVAREFQHVPDINKVQPRRNGGRTHTDEREDEDLIRREVKPEALKRKSGGRADAHWINGAIKHPGALHRELNVADDKRIPEKKLEKAEHSGNKLVAKRAHLAETLEHMGGRKERKDGGRAGKGKMSVNIIIAGGGKDQGAPMDGAMPPRPMPPPPMPPQGMAPPPQGPAMPPPGAMGALNGAQPPMMRRHGGRTMDAGAGSGLGRLEKAGY